MVISLFQSDVRGGCVPSLIKYKRCCEDGSTGCSHDERLLCGCLQPSRLRQRCCDSKHPDYEQCDLQARADLDCLTAEDLSLTRSCPISTRNRCCEDGDPTCTEEDRAGCGCSCPPSLLSVCCDYTSGLTMLTASKVCGAVCSTCKSSLVNRQILYNFILQKSEQTVCLSI